MVVGLGAPGVGGGVAGAEGPARGGAARDDGDAARGLEGAEGAEGRLGRAAGPRARDGHRRGGAETEDHRGDARAGSRGARGETRHPRRATREDRRRRCGRREAKGRARGRHASRAVALCLADASAEFKNEAADIFAGRWRARGDAERCTSFQRAARRVHARSLFFKTGWL